jgi:hypothetical protein
MSISEACLAGWRARRPTAGRSSPEADGAKDTGTDGERERPPGERERQVVAFGADGDDAGDDGPEQSESEDRRSVDDTEGLEDDGLQRRGRPGGRWRRGG